MPLAGLRPRQDSRQPGSCPHPIAHSRWRRCGWAVPSKPATRCCASARRDSRAAKACGLLSLYRSRLALLPSDPFRDRLRCGMELSSGRERARSIWFPCWTLSEMLSTINASPSPANRPSSTPNPRMMAFLGSTGASGARAGVERQEVHRGQARIHTRLLQLVFERVVELAG